MIPKETIDQIFESCVIDLPNVHNLYIRSQVGGYISDGPKGVSNNITNRQITYNYGYAMYDSVAAAQDYIVVSNAIVVNP